MASPLGLLVFLSWTPSMSVFCDAGHLPPPANLSYEWLDPFVVNVSWLRPPGVPEDCNIAYEYSSDAPNSRTETIWNNFTANFITEDVGSDRWTFTIRTISTNDCHMNTSGAANVTVKTPVPRAEVVKDFKCVLHPDKMNCSWIPATPSVELTLSYRICGRLDRKPLKLCDQPYSGERSGCYLTDFVREDVCMLVSSEAGRITFKPLLVVPPPELSVTEEGAYLQLKWTRPEIKTHCHWNYELLYSQCDKQKKQTFTSESGRITYDKSCRYNFRSRVVSDRNCPLIQSDFSVVTHGTNRPADRTLAVVPVVVSVFLCVCVVLSCYCFRRHRDLIFPTVPDPSAILKDMMVNDNKEPKTGLGNVYIPVPELVVHCKISPISENNVLLQNS